MFKMVQTNSLLSIGGNLTMHITMTVAYRRADCDDNSKVDISEQYELGERIEATYYYCTCGAIVYPRQGNINNWSFAHYSNYPHKTGCLYYEVPKNVIPLPEKKYDVELCFPRILKDYLDGPDIYGSGIPAPIGELLLEEDIQDVYKSVAIADTKVRSLEEYMWLYKKFNNGEKLLPMNRLLKGRALHEFFY